MTYKWIGAFLIIVGCGGFGFFKAANHKKEEKNLQQLLGILQYMENDLQYNLTPLPELCRHAGEGTTGLLHAIMYDLARELDWQVLPDACSCMNAALKKSKNVPSSLRKLLLQLGYMLGRFDLPGQLRGLKSVQEGCREELEKYRKNQDVRMRSYQTLGLCAGAALVILFA